MLVLIAQALALTPRTPLPPAPLVVPRASAAAHQGSPRLLVKLRDGERPSQVDATLRPLIHHDVSGLVERAQRRSGRAQPDYATLFQVEVRGGAMAATAEALADHGAVELAWASPGLVPPPRRPDPKTPEESYLALQRYHLSDQGVGSRDAWKLGFTGKGVRISDVEYGLNLGHEDIPAGRVAREKGITPINPFSEHHDHGTAVMGIAIAQPDKAGIRGIAHGAEGGIYPIYTEQHGLRAADAILKACGDSDIGDIVMLEMQTVAGTGYAPMEVEADVWMATRTCVDAGIVIVAAAGNGTQDLDGEPLSFWRQRGDSGAIMVGAGRGAHGSREAESFSNYGKRVDLQGWGSSVFSLGYGDHAMTDGDPDRSYTAQFGGTSAATPMVAGAAALLQQAARQQLGKPLDPDTLRQHLRSTGRKHQGPKRIGELPDVPRAIERLSRLQKGGGKAPARDGKARRARQAEAEPETAAPSACGSIGCATGQGWMLVPLALLGLTRRRRRS